MPRPRKTKASRAATLADVGREAGVSAMAASAVLNSVKTSSRISAETRERILQAAAKLQYRPNAAARALLHRRMDTIGVAAVLEQNDFSHYFLAVFNGILAGAAHYNQNTTVFALHDWGKDTQRLATICDGRIDGLILVAPTFDRDLAVRLPQHTPFVSIHANSLLPDVINIESDEENGAFAMVEHLIGKGHRRILHVAGPAGFTGADRRVSGYRRALKAHKIRFEKSLLVHSMFDSQHGYAAMKQWLRDHAGEPLPHAVFGGNDGIALGCMEALAEVGLRVPDDISVAGFDDTVASRGSMPQLTTVRQPLVEIGRQAADILLAKIGTVKDVKLPRKSPVVLPVDVLPRASVAKCPGVERLVPAVRKR